MRGRRRFLMIAAAGVAAGLTGPARSVVWRGRALGAEASIRLDGPMGAQALAAVRDTLARVEAAFSLFDPDSELSRLNRDGVVALSPEFQRLWPEVEAAHALTDGLFDPTVQARWRALAEGQVPRIGPSAFSEITAGEGRIRLPEGAALTLNGIAQGQATDRVFALLEALGFSGITVHVGEYRADAQGARLEIAGPGGALARTTLRGAAMATSGPYALTIGRGGAPHILHPWDGRFRPRWRTVSVEAGTAAMADALSTALCLTPDLALARRLRASGAVSRVWAEDRDGRVLTV